LSTLASFPRSNPARGVVVARPRRRPSPFVPRRLAVVVVVVVGGGADTARIVLANIEPNVIESRSMSMSGSRPVLRTNDA